MPVYLQTQPGENTDLVVWQITESSNELMSRLNDLLHDHQTKTPRDNKHWLASRLCLLHLFEGRRVEVSKDEFNKPHLTVDGRSYYLSITHSFDYAAVMVSSAVPVSLDLELTGTRIERVMNKFCNAGELSFLREDQKREQLTVIWSAKETLYKYYGRKKLDFRDHLIISPFIHDKEGYEIEGSVRKEDIAIDRTISVKMLGDYVLTVICG